MTGSSGPRQTRQTSPNRRWGLRVGDLFLLPTIGRWPSTITKRRRGHRPRGSRLGRQPTDYNLRKLRPVWKLRRRDIHRILHRHLQPSCSRKRLDRDRDISAD
uniref:uncharacterized protein LOC122609537 n=1 Tax=Erigeron canadensis TaxID=72917 RepID=UPI001CB9A6E8|nr:uncharacterized protein LOC122609537 [Erigeron canadensis]